MTEITINRTCAMLDRCEQFTSGRVGARIKFSFSSEWAGLSKTAVFTNGDTTIDVLNVADEITIPHEVLAISGKKLKVGVYGYTVGDNGNIEIAIPTVYADLGKVVKGADPSGDESTEPSLPVWAQTQALIGNLSELETEAKNNLVAAINEAAQTGSGGGSTVELDTTLTQSGKAADAKAVGDALAGKQNTISDLEAIRTGAAKGATALQSVPSTYRTASEQDTIDDGKVDKVTGKGLSSNDYTDAAKAKVDALAPVATSGSYNDLTNKPTIPTALPNPNALTFTGAVTGSYDGSAPLEVAIPSGGADCTIAVDMLASGTVVQGSEGSVDTGITLGKLKEYKMFILSVSGTSNVNLHNWYTKIDNLSIGRVNNVRGQTILYEFLNTEKTVMIAKNGKNGNHAVNTSYIASSESYGVVDTSCFPDCIYDLSSIGESTHVITYPVKSDIVDVKWSILGVVK